MFHCNEEAEYEVEGRAYGIQNEACGRYWGDDCSGICRDYGENSVRRYEKYASDG